MWYDQFDWVYSEHDYAVFPITIHPGVKFVTMNEMVDDFAQRFPRKK